MPGGSVTTHVLFNPVDTRELGENKSDEYKCPWPILHADPAQGPCDNLAAQTISVNQETPILTCSTSKWRGETAVYIYHLHKSTHKSTTGVKAHQQPSSASASITFSSEPHSMSLFCAKKNRASSQRSSSKQIPWGNDKVCLTYAGLWSQVVLPVWTHAANVLMKWIACAVFDDVHYLWVGRRPPWVVIGVNVWMILWTPVGRYRCQSKKSTNELTGYLATQLLREFQSSAHTAHKQRWPGWIFKMSHKPL